MTVTEVFESSAVQEVLAANPIHGRKYNRFRANHHYSATINQIYTGFQTGQEDRFLHITFKVKQARGSREARLTLSLDQNHAVYPRHQSLQQALLDLKSPSLLPHRIHELVGANAQITFARPREPNGPQKIMSILPHVPIVSTLRKHRRQGAVRRQSNDDLAVFIDWGNGFTFKSNRRFIVNIGFNELSKSLRTLFLLLCNKGSSGQSVTANDYRAAMLPLKRPHLRARLTQDYQEAFARAITRLRSKLNRSHKLSKLGSIIVRGQNNGYRLAITAQDGQVVPKKGGGRTTHPFHQASASH